MVIPRGNANPLGGELTRFVTRQLSVAVTVNVTLLLQTPCAALTIMLDGQLITGTSVSSMVTSLLQFPMQPVESLIRRLSVNEPAALVATITEELFVGPTMLPFPETDH